MTEQLVNLKDSVSAITTRPIPDRVVKNLAQSIFDILCNEGCQPRDIIGVSSQLIGLVATELERDRS